MPDRRPYQCLAHGNAKTSCPLCHPSIPKPLCSSEIEEYFVNIFCQRVDYVGDCWKWTGACHWGKSNVKYGTIYYADRRMAAHRFAYEFFVGPIQDGNVVHHACENTLCVNPRHLKQCDSTTHVRHHIQQAVRARWVNLISSKDTSLLNDKQLRIASMTVDGMTSTQIAERLGLTVKGIEFHKTNIKKIMSGRR